MMDTGYLAPPQQQPRLLPNGITFCCCCKNVSSKRVRCLNFCYAGFLMFYSIAVSYFVGFIGWSTNGSPIPYMLFNLAISLPADWKTSGGRAFSTFCYIVIPILFEIAPAALTIVAVRMLHKLIALSAVILMGISILLEVIATICAIVVIDNWPVKQKCEFFCGIDKIYATTGVMAFHILILVMRSIIIFAPLATFDLIKIEALGARAAREKVLAQAPSQWQSNATMQEGGTMSQIIASPIPSSEPNALGQTFPSS